MSTHEDDAMDESDKGEKKRQREKQRRSELASAFEELHALLNEIEPCNERYRRHSPAENESSTAFTRLDLVRKTTETLRRVHQENVELKQTLGQKSSNQMFPPITVASSWAPDQGHSFPGQQAQVNYYHGYPYQHNPYYRPYQPTLMPPPSERGPSAYTEGWDGNMQPQHPYAMQPQHDYESSSYQEPRGGAPSPPSSSIPYIHNN